MNESFLIDRFEADYAVLVRACRRLYVPRALLPRLCRPGDRLVRDQNRRFHMDQDAPSRMRSFASDRLKNRFTEENS